MLTYVTRILQAHGFFPLKIHKKQKHTSLHVNCSSLFFWSISCWKQMSVKCFMLCLHAVLREHCWDFVFVASLSQASSHRLYKEPIKERTEAWQTSDGLRWPNKEERADKTNTFLWNFECCNTLKWPRLGFRVIFVGRGGK